MTPERAYRLGVDPREVRVRCSVAVGRGRFWEVYVPDESRDRGVRVLTSGDVVYATQWRARLYCLAGLRL
jgi:hypothetical protein